MSESSDTVPKRFPWARSSIVLWAIGVVTVALRASAAFLKPAATEVSVAQAGPFEIRAKTERISSGRFPNISGQAFEKMPVSSYRVYHKGIHQQVMDVDQDSGGKVTFDDFWDALILDDAPHPSLIVACTGVYLMTEREGRVWVDVLAPVTTSIATLGWIDGPDGQPGSGRNVTIRDSSRESRHSRGGRYLLVNRKVVLDVNTLKRTVLPSEAATVGEPNGVFNATGDPCWLSPGRTQYAFVGDRGPEVNQPVVDMYYAVVVVDFLAGSAYAVPFDRNRTHYHIPESAPATWHHDWFAHYFRWTRDPEGRERLEFREDAKTLPWTGLLRRGEKGLVQRYDIEMAAPSLLPVLEAFIAREFGGKRVTTPEDPQGVYLAVGACTLHLAHSEESRQLSLYPSHWAKQSAEQVSPDLERIGQRFNEELQRGMHQQHFYRLAGVR